MTDDGIDLTNEKQGEVMNWEYIDDGMWEALSQFHDQMDSFRWIIKVCEDGKFDVNESDDELCNGVAAFDTFAEAKTFCQKTEDELVNGLTKPR